jgi:hypothetical protein
MSEAMSGLGEWLGVTFLVIMIALGALGVPGPLDWLAPSHWVEWIR